MSEERLQKIMSRAGIASRRASEELIAQGRVTVNGKTAKVGDKADPTQDTIRVDGEKLKLDDAKLVYIMLNKPAGVVSAVSAQPQEKRSTVRDLIPGEEHLFPVGRLDADSEGLILLTNDGDLTQRLTHPSFGHYKTYRVLVKGRPSDAKLDEWASGVELSDGKTSPCEVSVHKELENATWLQIKMGEGRKRQIRRTAAALHLYVERLIRIRIGKLRLFGLKQGEWRYLTDEEIKELKDSVKNRPASKTRRMQGSRPAAKPDSTYTDSTSHKGKPGGSKGNPPRRNRS